MADGGAVKASTVAEAHKRNHAGESLATVAESLGMTRDALRGSLTRYRRAYGLEAPPRDHQDPAPSEAPLYHLVVGRLDHRNSKADVRAAELDRRSTL